MADLSAIDAEAPSVGFETVRPEALRYGHSSANHRRGEDILDRIPVGLPLVVVSLL